MKIGIQSSYLSRYGVAAGAQRMKAHGYDCVDYNLSNTEDAMFQLSEAAFEKQLREVQRTLSAAGIRVSQTHGPWRYPARDFTPEDRAERFDSMAKAIRGSAYLETEYCVIHPIMPFGANSPEHPQEMREINAEFWERLCRIGREYGVKVCLENMPFPSLPIATTAQVSDFVKQMNNDWFRVCLDTGHCLVCGESPAEAVRRIGREHLAVLHVHDNDGVHDLHQNPGQGVLDWPGFTAALNEIGFDGVFSLETYVQGEHDDTEQERLERELADTATELAGNPKTMP